MFGYPKKGVLKGKIREDGQGMTNDWIDSTENQEGVLYHINRDTLPSYQDYLAKYNPEVIIKPISEQEFNTTITSVVDSAESELTYQQMLDGGFIVEAVL
jgi:hypothetical protein